MDFGWVKSIFQAKRQNSLDIAQAAPAVEAKRENMLFQGNGANTRQDRGAMHRVPPGPTQNPYFLTNTIERSQAFLEMFNTYWEAQKMVTIPVDDALRYRAEIKGISDGDAKDLWKAYDDRDLDKQNRRALVQERLFGGCLAFGVFKTSSPSMDWLAEPLRLHDIQKGDFEALNVFDVTMVGQEAERYNPFSPDFDRPPRYRVNGHPVDSSRLILLDGSPVVNRFSQSTLERNRVGNFGFGESVLVKLYETIKRATGAQNGAYHLINLSSCLIIMAEHLRSMKASNAGAQEALDNLAEDFSIYRATVVDGKEVKISQHAASFGAVPELMMMYMQFLSAAGDIPAARYLSQAPGGLNTTGESDLQNYNSMVRANVQMGKLKPLQLREFDWIGCSLWGFDGWMRRRENLEIDYPPLWNETAKEKADRMAIYSAGLGSLISNGTISGDAAVKELVAQGFFMTEMEAMDALMGDPRTEESPLDPKASIAELAKKGIPQKAVEAGAQKKENARDWDESMCHRDDKGQFGEGGGGGKEAAATSQDEKQKKIDSVKIDFSRDNILPGLNQEDLAALGKEDKPVLLKKDIVTKNLKHHPEVAKEDYDRIVGQSLYNPDGIFPGSSKEPRFNFVSRIGDDKSTLTLLEMAETKDNYEIINLHWIKDRQRKQKERGK